MDLTAAAKLIADLSHDADSPFQEFGDATGMTEGDALSAYLSGVKAVLEAVDQSLYLLAIYTPETLAPVTDLIESMSDEIRSHRAFREDFESKMGQEGLWCDVMDPDGKCEGVDPMAVVGLLGMVLNTDGTPMSIEEIEGHIANGL